MAEKYNLDITITLDIPAGGDYDLTLYDAQGNQVGVGWSNKNGGKSVYVPDWDMASGGYMVRVRPKDGIPVQTDRKAFSLQQENGFYVIYPQMFEMQSFGWCWRRLLLKEQEKRQERLGAKNSPERLAASYNEQLEQVWRLEELRQKSYEEEV